MRSSASAKQDSTQLRHADENDTHLSDADVAPTGPTDKQHPKEASFPHVAAPSATRSKEHPKNGKQLAAKLEKRVAYRFVKRAFDIAFSAVVLVFLCWLFAIIAIAIKLEDPKSPVIFKQARVGKNGGTFTMYKFRSMRTDAESLLDELQSRNEVDGPAFKMADDPRVTRTGKVLRKLSLDELPQFVNVLAGDMSIVGPRPALPREVAVYTPFQRQRLLAKPGITCYWQTRKNKEDIPFDEWVNLDLVYMQKCGIWTDFKIIVQTVGVVLSAQGI